MSMIEQNVLGRERIKHVHKRRQKLQHNHLASGKETEKCLQPLTKACGGWGVLGGALNSGPVAGSYGDHREPIKV